MKLKELKAKITNLLIFTKDDLRNLESREGALSLNIKYWLKNKELLSLKKGVYAWKERYDKEEKKDLFLEYIANRLVQPSYLSLEYVLAKYQLLSEPANAITSITVKTTREINNFLGMFRYYSISADLFKGYRTKRFLEIPVFEASKEKALFDFIYLRFIREREVTENEVENLRINWELLSKKEFKKVKSFGISAKNPRVKNILALIEKKYYGRAA